MLKHSLFPDLDEDFGEEPGDEAIDYEAERNRARGAEYLVAYDISRRGLTCFMAAEGLRYDLLVEAGGLRRVQVKSVRRAAYRGQTSRTLSYTFGGKGGDNGSLKIYRETVDLLALVALDRGMVLYMPTMLIVAHHVHLPAAQFTPEWSEQSWDAATKDWGL